MTVLLQRIDRWWYAPAPPERLAVLRMIVGAFAVAYLALRWPNLVSYADYPEDRFEGVGLVALLDGPLPGLAVQLLVAAALVAGLAFVCGWKYRAMGPVFALLLLWVTTYRNSFGQVFHTENLLVLHVIVLAAAPAADALSLDARGRAAAEADGRYGWPLQLMCVVTVLAYFISGQTKLRNAGIDWVSGENLRNYVAYDNLRKIELGDVHSPLADWLVPHAWLFTPMAALTLIVELCAPLALLGRGIARVWAMGAWLFHIGILATMAIVFPYPLLGVAFVPFFSVERFRLPSWAPSPSRLRRVAEG